MTEVEGHPYGNYLWQKDIEICLNLDLDTLAAGPQFQTMRELNHALLAQYGSEDKSDAA